MAGLYQRTKGGSWYIKFRHPVTGAIIRRSLNTTNRKTADEKRILLQAELIRGKAEEDELTLEGLRSRYHEWAAIHHRSTTIIFNTTALDRFVEFYGDKPISRIRLADVERWKAWLLNRKVPHTDRRVSVTTVNNYRRGMVQLVNRAIKLKWYVGENPFLESERIREDRKKVRPLDGEQMKAVLEAAEMHSRDLHLICGLGLYAGLRKAEIIAARWSWVNLKANLLHIQAGHGFQVKDGDDRTVELHESLREILEFHRDGQTDGWIVRPEKEPGIAPYRFEMIKGFTSVMRAADVPWASCQTLRRTFASQLVSNGVDIYTVSQWLGHASVSTTQKAYAHLIPSHGKINVF